MLASTVRLTPNFTAGELGADNPVIPADAEQNLYTVARWLEFARSAIGVPLRVTSGYRTASHNAAVGGSGTSDHITGLAADFVPVGTSPWSAYARLRDVSHDAPPWDQIIFYADGHIHVGLGPRMRREWRANISGEYPLLTTEKARQLLPFVVVLILILVMVRYV